MEQSKLISGIIAKFKITYPYYFKELQSEELVLLVNMYQEQFSRCHPEILNRAVDVIIRTSKFMPTIADILEAYTSQRENYTCEVLEVMKTDGYFKKGPYGELSDEQADRNYIKAKMWITEENIPGWLLEDMKRYGFKKNFNLKNTTTNLLEGK